MTTVTASRLKQTALSYGERGWPVFPLHHPTDGRCSCGKEQCPSPGKHPRTPNGVKDATTDLIIIAEWWDRWPDANIGVATGLASGLVVVDVDPRHCGDVTWAELLDMHGAPDTLTTMTGSGGTHWIFQAPEQALRNTASTIGEGIDTRAEGGYIVAPPSMHISGQRYEWTSKVKPAPIPDWLRKPWPIQNGSKPSPADTAPQEAIIDGFRNDYLARLAGAAKRRGASEEGIQCLLHAENSVRCDPPLDTSEVETIAHSISRYEAPKLSLNGHSPDTSPLDHPGWDVVVQRTITDGKTIYFRAGDIRKEKTGVHAKVEALFNGIPLGWDVFNIDRLRDRHDLGRKCHARLNKIWEGGIDQEVFGSYLDEFCRDLWRSRLKDLSPTELVGNPDIPVDMILGDYIIGGGGTILFAPPGRGKSWIGLLMACSVDAGISDVWNVPVARKCLFVNLERSAESVQRRLGFVNTALGLESFRPLLVLNARGKSLSDVRYVVESAIKEYGVDVLFLDSISRSGQGSLLDDRAVNQTIDILNNLAKTYLAIGHTPRGDESHLFGSVMFEAGADLVVRLATEYTENGLGIGLKVEKSNDTPKPPMQQLALEFDRFGLSGVRAAQRGEFEELAAGSQSKLQQLIDFVLAEGKSTLANAAKATGIPKTTASRLFDTSGKFVRFGEGQNIEFGVKQWDT